MHFNSKYKNENSPLVEFRSRHNTNWPAQAEEVLSDHGKYSVIFCWFITSTKCVAQRFVNGDMK
jgi:membrane protein DedA with SNARE-associated domain